MTKNKIKQRMALLKREITVEKLALSVIGSAVLSFGLYNIHSISGITEGGILGLILLLYHHISLSPSVSGLILNTLCYLFGWKTLGDKFIFYSAVSGGAFSLFYALFEFFPPLFPSIAAYPLASAILGALFVGVGVGLCVRAGGAPGGDDALAMSLASILGVKLTAVYLVTDLTVLLLSLTYIPLSKIIYSLITVILSGQIIDIVNKPKIIKVFSTENKEQNSPIK